MFKLFRKRLKIEKVAADVVEDFMDTQLRLINGLLDESTYKHASIQQAEESVAFVYVIAIFGIQVSLIEESDKHRFCMAITDLWSEKLIRPKWEAVPFLQRRLEEYRHAQDLTRSIQKYMQHLEIDGPRNAAFLAAMIHSATGRITGIRTFVNDVSRKYNFV